MPASPAFDVVVVGAGVAGLFCATALADAGLRACVVEARASACGRARSWHDAGMDLEVDIGPHVVSSEHLNFLGMLRRLGTDVHVRWQPEPMITLLEGQRLMDVACPQWLPPFHGLPNVPMVLRRLGLRATLSHWRVAWRCARLTEQGLRALDDVDALAWLRRLGAAAPAIDWFWRSTMLSLLNVRLEECSAAACARVFRLMLGRSGYHFGFPTVGLSALYVPACTAAIRARGGEVLTGTPVRSLAIEDGAVRGVRLRTGATVRAPWCVLAVAPWNAAPLLARTRAPRLAALEQAARSFLGAPYTSTVLAIDHAPGAQRFWARVWNPQDLNTDFYELARIRPELAGQRSVVACNAIGPNARLHWNDDQVIARTMEELDDFAPGTRAARVRGACVHRIRAAIPQPRPGVETSRPGPTTPVGGLLLAGDWTDTAVPCSMESAARSAAFAAERILGTPLALPAPETCGLVGILRARAPRHAEASRA